MYSTTQRGSGGGTAPAAASLLAGAVAAHAVGALGARVVSVEVLHLACVAAWPPRVTARRGVHRGVDGGCGAGALKALAIAAHAMVRLVAWLNTGLRCAACPLDIATISRWRRGLVVKPVQMAGTHHSLSTCTQSAWASVLEKASCFQSSDCTLELEVKQMMLPDQRFVALSDLMGCSTALDATRSACCN